MHTFGSATMEQKPDKALVVSSIRGMANKRTDGESAKFYTPSSYLNNDHLYNIHTRQGFSS